jgi:AraC-like DNA-binding protein
MTITLTHKDCDELYGEAREISLIGDEPFESVKEVPRQLGKGSIREIQLHPQLQVLVMDETFHDHVLEKISVWNHPLQFGVYLSGGLRDSCGFVADTHTIISGSGIQRKITVEHPPKRFVGIDIYMEPEVLGTFFPTASGDIPEELKFLTKGNDWQALIYQKITPAMRVLAQQIIDCPYQGIVKRIYLHGKVFELIALQLAPFLQDKNDCRASLSLTSDTIMRVRRAREIIITRLENPPSLRELAQQVEVSERTLRRGFQELFGTTVFGCLRDKRMEQAEEWLRRGNFSVVEVANLVGYTNPGHFAAAFKRKFGITPSQCLLGKKAVSR